MIHGYNLCGCVLSEEENCFGNIEDLICLKDSGHSGRHTHASRETFLQPEIHSKIKTVSWNTSGNKYPYKNRASRWNNSAKPITKIEGYRIKEQNIQGSFKPLYESSTYKDCVDVYLELLYIAEEVVMENQHTFTRCPLCLEQLKKDHFIVNARDDDKGAQACHVEALSEIQVMHRGGNVRWGHRICNAMQSDRSIEETLQSFKYILIKHGVL